MLIYAAIAAFGVLVLLIMLFVGEVFGGDHDLSHEIEAGHGDVDHGGGPSLFSTRVIASFFTAFGVGGIVARYYHLSHPLASGVGIVSGVVMSSLVYQFAKILYSQQASSEIRMTGLVGMSARVSVTISAGGVGQISVTARGEQSEHIARSADGQAVARGESVNITQIRGDSVIVAPAASVEGTPGGSG